MPDFVPISYSRINSFKECPRRFNEMSIAKSIPWVQSDAQRQGEVIHKMLSARVSGNVPLPPGYGYLEPICASIIAAPGQTFTDLQLTFTKDLEQCGAKDWNRAWLRMELDVAKFRLPTVWAGDYKTGKRFFDELQLEMYAAGVFQAFPDVETVATSFLWLQEKGFDKPTTYERAQSPEIWRKIKSYSLAIEEAKAANVWPPRPNRFCRSCPVLKAGKCEEGQRSLRR
jgi:hypothetical protein